MTAIDDGEGPAHARGHAKEHGGRVPALAAAVFRQQAFVMDLAANPLGLTNSNAITATLGVR
ncbi:MAG: hypothetical protein WAT39_04660 [Planctomycetota bacterium]